MRRLIIDTDTGSDDAVALIMGLKSEDLHIEAITTVCGNVPLKQATKNAMMTVEVTDKQKPPVYMGASKPLMRDLVTATNVHGDDGMGDCNLIHPTLSPEKEHAVDIILSIVNKYPHEIEILTIGPVTNIALAIMKDPETMKKVKHIYTMGTGGFGPGNITPVAEFNVYVDAEAFKILLNASIKLTIIGFDVCLGDAALNKSDFAILSNSPQPEARFAIECNRVLLDYNLKAGNGHIIDLPDAVAMGVLMWEDIIKDSRDCYCYACTIEEPAYGQVIVDDHRILANDEAIVSYTSNATVIKTLDNALFKQRLINLLIS